MSTEETSPREKLEDIRDWIDAPGYTVQERLEAVAGTLDIQPLSILVLEEEDEDLFRRQQHALDRAFESCSSTSASNRYFRVSREDVNTIVNVYLHNMRGEA